MTRPLEVFDEWLDRIDAETSPEAVRTVLETAAQEESLEFARQLACGAEIDWRPDEVSSEAFEDYPGYCVEEELTGGGMSTVYRATRIGDPDGEQFAIKVVANLDPRYLERFEREKAVLRTISHPQISSFIEDGKRRDGRPYFVMELVDGTPLADYAEKLNPREIVELVMKLAEPLVLAHLNMVLHRDLKPSNVLVRSDGTPVLLDFGIAKTDTLHQTSTGDRALTLLYAAPEQVLNDHSTVQTDVHGLGLLLYKLLTGRVPYDGDRAVDWLQNIRTKDPLPIAKALELVGRPKLSADLALVIDKSLRKNPRERYEFCSTFASDLGHALSGRPITARPHSSAYIVRRLVSRYRIPIGLVASLLVAFSAFGAYHYVQLKQQKEVAETAREAAEVARDDANEVVDFMEKVFRVADPKESRNAQQLSAEEILQQGAVKAEAELVEKPAIRAALLKTIGTVMLNLGAYERSVDVLGRARELDESRLGELNLDMIESLCAEGTAKRQLGETLGAIELFEGCRSRYARLDGIEAEVGESRAQLELAKAYVAEHDHRARPLLEEGVERLRDRDEMSSLYFEYVGVHVGVLLHAGELTGLEQLLRDALSARLAFNAPDHPDVAEAQNDLAIILGTLEAYDEARTLLLQSLKSRTDRLGPVHVDIAENLNNLGLLEKRAGRLDAAIHYYQEALAMQQTIGGASHPRGLSMLQNLALALRASGRSGEALAEVRRGLEAAASLDAPALESDLHTVAGLVYLDADENQRAGEHLRLAVQNAESGYSPTHWRTLFAVALLESADDRLLGCRTAQTEASQVIAENAVRHPMREGWRLREIASLRATQPSCDASEGMVLAPF